MPGPYLISATWEPFIAGASSDATLTATSGGNSFSTGVNQGLAPNDFTQAGTGWRRMGVLDVNPADGIGVELSGDSGLLLADAIRIDPAPRVAALDPFGQQRSRP